MKICAIIPCYNEEADIGQIIDGTLSHVDKVLVIDNGSTDRTGEIAVKHGAQLIIHKKPQGVGSALYRGYQYVFNTNYEFMVQLDGDGQHDPDYIPKMQIAMLENHADVVIGTRFSSANKASNVHRIRRIGNKVFSFFVDILGPSTVTDFSSGYRLWRVDSLQELGLGHMKYWAMEQTLKANFRRMTIVELPMHMPERTNGQSHLNLNNFARYPIANATLFAKTLVTEMRR